MNALEDVFRVLKVLDLDFTDDRGRKGKGQQLWLMHPIEDDLWNCYEVIKVWIPEGHPAELDVAPLERGDFVRIEYDRCGNLVNVFLVS